MKIIKKKIIYSPLDDDNLIYNLTLGDCFDDGTISDLTISDNHDMERVLSTVVQSMLEFFSLRPNSLIYFTGSTTSRTRLYRIAISNYKNDFDELFVIYGLIYNYFEPFEINKNYDAFLISLKS